MRVMFYDPFLTAAANIHAEGWNAVSLDELLEASDFITLHVPMTEQTRGMLGREQFAKMKNGVRIVDAARGGIIDEAALLDALNSGKVAGAALDVFATEPPGQVDLVCHPHVIATPHIGAQTVEAQARAANDIATEILRALRDEELRWRVA
jgi:D-3-phosphoglycerate dehydrogenase